MKCFDIKKVDQLSSANQKLLKISKFLYKLTLLPRE